MVRAARSEDIPAVLELWGVARTRAAVTPDTAEAVELLLEVASDGLLVAESDGRIVGALVAGWDGWRGNMYRLAVLPEYRRRGIARELVDAGHSRLRAKGARRVTAIVGKEDDHAKALWEAAGYEFDEHVGRFVRNL
jgi:ribosomal protein S18 acetylase RimI-like enzyme